MKDRAFRLGCDIGGTFTDFVLVNDETGTFSIYKCLTTPSDPSDAVETGIRGLEQQTPGFMPEVAEIIHGTTSGHQRHNRAERCPHRVDNHQRIQGRPGAWA